MDEPNGLIATGGDLSPQRLLAAYRRGIFPWYQTPQPILWWTPDPRSVLLPCELHISRSLRKRLRQNSFELAVDTRFSDVMQLCGKIREKDPGTWIDGPMLAAYTELHQMGVAHSIEVFSDGELVGGLYGINLGRIFFGESMFSTRRDASKIALVGLTDIALRGKFPLIDCQVENDHLNSLGAKNISRLAFEEYLEHTTDVNACPDIWHLPVTSGALV